MASVAVCFPARLSLYAPPGGSQQSLCPGLRLPVQPRWQGANVGNSGLSFPACNMRLLVARTGSGLGFSSSSSKGEAGKVGLGGGWPATEGGSRALSVLCRDTGKCYAAFWVWGGPRQGDRRKGFCSGFPDRALRGSRGCHGQQELGFHSACFCAVAATQGRGCC